MSTLSQEEIKRYFSVENEAEAPKYAIVYVEHVNSKKAMRHVTAETIAEAAPQFKFQFDNEEIHMTLKQDDSFLAPELEAIRVITDDGEYWEPIQRDCLYRGYVTKYGSKKSSAQISTCSGMMGSIYRDDDGPVFIEPMTDEDASKRDIGRGLAHIAYRRRESQNEHQFCEAVEIDQADAAKYPTVPPKDDDLYAKNTRASKHLDMYVFADKALYDKRGSITASCIIAMMNSVTNGISWLGDLTASMKGSTIISGSNNQGLSPSSDGLTYLQRAAAWQKTQSGSSGWDVVAVMTGLDISSSSSGSGLLGIAYVGAACSNNKASVSEMRDWSVVDVQIHETGHNLGCYHDSDGNSCSASGGIMAAYINCYYCEPQWSSCSKSYYSSKASSFTCM